MIKSMENLTGILTDLLILLGPLATDHSLLVDHITSSYPEPQLGRAFGCQAGYVLSLMDA
jgi:hypothetical protein